MKEETPYLTITSKEYYDLLKIAKHAKAITLIRDDLARFPEYESFLKMNFKATCDELETDLQELEKGIAPAAYLNAK